MPDNDHRDDFDINEEAFVKYTPTREPESNQIEPVPIPLPTEVPEPPNLSQLPPDILHSGTVETLIGQNDDLMARLKVTLRRQSVLEQDILNLNRQKRELSKVCDNLENQNQILKVKDQQSSQRQIKVENELIEIKEDLQLYEIRYGELSEKYESKKVLLQNTETRVKWLERSRRSIFRRIKKWVRPLISELRRTNLKLNDQCTGLNSTIEAEQLKVMELKERTSQLVEQIQTIEAENRKKVTELVQHYEQNLAELSKNSNIQIEQIENLTKSEEALKIKAQKATALANENIRLSRLLEETRQRNESDLTNVQSDLNRYRAEAKTNALEAQDTKDQLDRVRTQYRSLEDEHKSIVDQLESLQLLWAQKQKAYTQLEEKYVNLQLINRELAQSIDSSKETQNHEQFSVHLNQSPQVQQKIKDVRKAQQSMQKIEGLIAEIQSGCSASTNKAKDDPSAQKKEDDFNSNHPL